MEPEIKSSISIEQLNKDIDVVMENIKVLTTLGKTLTVKVLALESVLLPDADSFDERISALEKKQENSAYSLVKKLWDKRFWK